MGPPSDHKWSALSKTAQLRQIVLPVPVHSVHGMAPVHGVQFGCGFAAGRWDGTGKGVQQGDPVDQQHSWVIHEGNARGTGGLLADEVKTKYF